MKKIITFLILAVMVNKVYAQQRPQYSQYMINNYLLNPAISGIEDYTDVKIGTRQQWVGLEGAPKTFYVSAHTPLNKQTTTVRGRSITSTRTIKQNRFARPVAHHGVGIMAIRDKTGPLNRTNVNATYAYHLPLAKGITMSLGANAGILRYSFNSSEATYSNPADPAINGDYINRNYFDVGLGTWIYSDKFFVGFSGAQLLKGKRDLNPSESTETNGVLQKHYFATGGYKFDISPEVSVIPSVMAKFANPSPTTVDFNVKAIYADRVWVGASYRNEDAFAFMGGVNISHIMDLSYSYDYNTSNLRVANSGTHEVVLGFKLFNKGRLICPRWMH